VSYDPGPLVEAACDVLRTLGPLDAATLATHIDPALFSDDVRPHERAEELDLHLMDSDRVCELPGGRLAEADTLLSGLVLTHRLSEREVSLGGVDIEPDLGPLLGFDRDGFELVGEGRTEIVYPEDLGERGEDVPVNGSLFGPPGWLRSFGTGDLVAFRRRGGTLEVSAADPDAERTKEAVAALRASWGSWRAESTIVFAVSCVFTILDASPEVLRSHVLPLSEIAREAGLSFDVDRLVDPLDQEEQVSEGLARIYGLEECCTEALAACSGFALVIRDGAEPPAETCRGFADLLAHGSVASVFCDLHLGPHAKERGLVESFVDTVGRHARGRGRAAVRFVESIVADVDGDAVEAERLSVAALSEDREYEPALLALAGFAEDRGDVTRAISYFSRLEGFEARIERLRPLAEPKHRAGRNDPCPCGSGRKYKVCCATTTGATLGERAPWLYERAAKWALGPTRRGLTRALARERAGGEDPGDPAPDLASLEFALFEEGLLEAYLDGRAALLPADELDLGRRWVGTPRTVWEVASVRPGRDLELIDMSSGDRVTAVDVAVSRALHVDDWLWARVVTDGTRNIIVGGPTLVPMRARQSLLELMDSAPDGFEMASWLAAADTVHMSTFEGETIVMCEARYRIGDAAAARTGLAERLEASSDDSFVDKVDVRGDDIVRGFVRLEGDVATITTNAEERFARLRTLLLETAPDAVLLSEKRTDAAQAMREARADDARTEAPSLEDLPPEARAEVERALDEQMTRWEERWVDEAIPALGGSTPREALDDPTRRSDLIALLREMEERTPVAAGVGRGMDPNRLRKLLGLEGPAPKS
jgi:hypothetical protein